MGPWLRARLRVKRCLLIILECSCHSHSLRTRRRKLKEIKRNRLIQEILNFKPIRLSFHHACESTADNLFGFFYHARNQCLASRHIVNQSHYRTARPNGALNVACLVKACLVVVAFHLYNKQNVIHVHTDQGAKRGYYLR